MNLVPLPARKQGSSQQQTAVAIRDGRLAVKRLSDLSSYSTGSTNSGQSVSGMSTGMEQSDRRTSLSTVLEKDFTVRGKQSSLQCPFTRRVDQADVSGNQVVNTDGAKPDLSQPLKTSDVPDNTPHHSTDPICAAMYAETMSSPPPSVTASAAKCPIRFLDQHSPEEVARYFETHKHEIPRSHEICVKHYQKSEEDIRKLDAKYGNLVSMIQGLGQMHQPLLPAEGEVIAQAEEIPDDRVKSWANDVNETGADHDIDQVATGSEDDDRDSRFDRALKEVRVGESPSRPWGISVPIYDERAPSPPPAPVPVPLGEVNAEQPRPAGKCPFDHGARGKPSFVSQHDTSNPAGNPHVEPAQEPSVKGLPHFHTPTQPTQPTFVQPSCVSPNTGPQMIFTGPVFIGYPMEQAIQLMQQYKGN